jgi:hypothetical protein
VSAKQKSQRGFVAVTLITILAIALVIVAYATILGTFQGGNVTVVTLHAEMWYSVTNSSSASWTSTLSDVGNGSQWYSRLNITAAGGYTGLVNVNWALYFGNNTAVSGATATTSNFDSTGTLGQTIYASSTGNIAGNKNWGAYSTVATSYYVKATVSTV